MTGEALVVPALQESAHGDDPLEPRTSGGGIGRRAPSDRAKDLRLRRRRRWLSGQRERAATDPRCSTWTRDAAGCSVSATQTVDGRKLSTLSLEDAPADLIQSRQSSRNAVEALTDLALIALSAELLGVMEKAQEITFDYLRIRKQFGKPIGSFQALQHQAVNIYIRIETTRSLVYQVAANNDPYRIDPALAVAVKAKASEDAMFVTEACIQIHGAIGFTDEHDIGLYLKRAMLLSSLFGNAAAQRRRYVKIAELTAIAPRSGTSRHPQRNVIAWTGPICPAEPGEVMSEEQTVTYELDGEVALVGLNRPDKRNCFNPTVMKQLREAIERAGEEAKCGIIFGHGDNFCAGLDLRWAAENWKNGRSQRLPFPFNRNTYFEAMARGNIPFIAALHGATLGGGLETAAAAHIRVADETTFFGLPEGTRGIFIGGGGSVRVARLIGFARMQDMMLTGRVLKPDEAERYGIVQYLVPKGQSMAKAKELALKICKNAPLSNFAITNSLPRLQDLSYDDGLFFERMVAEYTRSPESIARLNQFLDKTAPRVRMPE